MKRSLQTALLGVIFILVMSSLYCSNYTIVNPVLLSISRTTSMQHNMRTNSMIDRSQSVTNIIHDFSSLWMPTSTSIKYATHTNTNTPPTSDRMKLIQRDVTKIPRSNATKCTVKHTRPYRRPPCVGYQNCNAGAPPLIPRIPTACSYRSWPIRTQQSQQQQRRLVFVGDSVMRQIFMAVIDIFMETTTRISSTSTNTNTTSNSTTTNTSTTVYSATMVKPDLPVPMECRHIVFNDNPMDHYLTTVCFVEAGRNAGKKRIARDNQGRINVTDCESRVLAVDRTGFFNVNLGDTMDCLTERRLLHSGDIVVANTGVHHPLRETLEENTNTFIQWAKSIPRSSNICVVWRQTLPQHFNTPTGSWGSGLMHTAQRVVEMAKRQNTSCCAPLPANSGTQHSNSITDKLVRDAQIPSIFLYNAMAPLWKYHNDCSSTDETKVDCTHWNQDATRLMAQLVLDRLQDLC